MARPLDRSPGMLRCQTLLHNDSLAKATSPRLKDLLAEILLELIKTVSERGDSFCNELSLRPHLLGYDIEVAAAFVQGVTVATGDIVLFQPLHIICIVYMGLLLGEIFDLEALAEDCARAVASPINPLAIK